MIYVDNSLHHGRMGNSARLRICAARGAAGCMKESTLSHNLTLRLLTRPTCLLAANITLHVGCTQPYMGSQLCL
jgi:hypothetical protein